MLEKRIEEKKAKGETYCIKTLFKEIGNDWKNQLNMDEWIKMSSEDAERYEREIENFYSQEDIQPLQNYNQDIE